MPLPETPLGEDELFARLEGYRANDLDWRSGRTFGFTFDAGKRAEAIGKRAFMAFLSENGLDPTSFPSLLKLENEVVGMLRDHLRGDDQVVGTFTSGGTESILLAVKTARDLARATRPEITAPEMVLPVTAHAAFHKAASYFDVRVVSTPVDADIRADVDAMRAAITPQTILLVGSAPSYAHGTMDPIVEIGALAEEKGLLFHVDGCMGGFLLPLLRELGEDVPRFELDVPGVTSLSVDLHKYAFAPKGASVVLQRNRAQRFHQLFACAQWSGYSMINPTVQSTKSGGPLAAAWAVLHGIGREGYLELARAMRTTTNELAAGVRSIPGLRVLGNPVMTLLAFASDGPSVFHIADEMAERGWYVQPQLAFAGIPESIHLSVGPTNAAHVKGFVADLAASVEAARALPQGQLGGMLEGMLEGLTPEAITPDTIGPLLAMVGVQPGALPGRRAEINELLNALPRPIVERMLQAFVNEMFTQPALAEPVPA